MVGRVSQKPQQMRCRGSRIIRRFCPKGTDISRFTKRQIQQIEDWINALPRKILDGLSAENKVELYFEKVAA